MRFLNFAEALQRGAEAGGGRIRIGFTGNFWNNEVYTIQPKLPSDIFLHGWKSDVANVYHMSQDPICGPVNPAAVIAAMENFDNPNIKELFFIFHCNNHLGNEPLETIERVTDIVEDYIKNPAPKTVRGRLDKLYSLCKSWGAESNADAIFEAFVAFDAAAKFKSVVTGGLPHTHAASMRYFVRPLVIKPELLTPEEESYFLPYIFNVRENEARMDYLDCHGGRIEINPLLRTAAERLVAAAEKFEAIDDVAQSVWFNRLALSIRIWASALRSACNFYEAQVIRDRYAEILAGPDLIPEKKGSFDGDPDNLLWNKIMRDEFDNTAELLAVLERGGRDLICCAEIPEEEMSFALPPDLVGALRKKMTIMRDHWRDVEKYLAPPHK